MTVFTGARAGTDFDAVRACGVSCQSTNEPAVVAATLPIPISTVSVVVSRFPRVRADIRSPSLTNTPDRPAVSDMRNRTLPQDAWLIVEIWARQRPFDVDLHTSSPRSAHEVPSAGWPIGVISDQSVGEASVPRARSRFA